MDESARITENETGLVRQLGMFDSTMMMVGIVIGSGIFLTTGIMAESLPSAPLILAAWIFGGVITLAGALTYAELGAAMPEAGGHYVYLREAYGPMWGFLFGWQLFLVAMCGSIAALAVAFAEYLGYFVPALSTEKILFSANLGLFSWSLSAGQIAALVLIILLSLVNWFGVSFGKLIQNVITVVKIGTILIFVGAGILIGKGTPVEMAVNPAGLSFGEIVVAFGVSLIAVSWAFDGWNNINYVAGEIKNPKRNLPFSLVAGTLIITVLYGLVNYVYLYALPIGEMAGNVRIAETASSALFGDTAAGLVSAAVLISVFGALNGSVIVGPRVFYAMANDGLFFRKVAEVHPKYRTPGFSIFVQAVWSCILTVTGSFEQIFTFVMFVTIFFWIAATASVFTLRKKRPDMPRPYKTWGYPFTPLLFIVVSVGILVNTLIERPVESLAGVFMVACGIPVFLMWFRKNNKKAN